MAEVDVTREERSALDDDGITARDDATTEAGDGVEGDAADARPGGRRRPGRARRTLRSDLRRLAGTPARRGRLAVVVFVLAVAGAAPLLARAGVSDARVEARSQGAERGGAAETRAEVEAAERAATAQEAAAVDLAAQARAAHNEQRRRLAGLGLNEQTVDAFLVEVTGNAELVEFRRDRTTREVDRQATEIPQMQECVRVASQTLNAASNNAMIDRSIPVPSPAELCVALLAAGT